MPAPHAVDHGTYVSAHYVSTVHNYRGMRALCEALSTHMYMYNMYMHMYMCMYNMCM